MQISGLKSVPSCHALTRAQARMWFLHRLNPQSSAYTVASGLLFPKPLNASHLRQAIASVVCECDALRMGFVVAENAPCSVVAGPSEHCPDIRRVDAELRDLPNAAATRLAAASRATFNLFEGKPPVWFELLTLEDGDVGALVVSQHHIITDGWSLGLLWERLAAAYKTASLGERYDGPAAASFIDFTENVSEPDIEFWTRQFRGAAALDLPFAKRRPSQQDFDGESIDIVWSTEVQNAVAGLARELHTSPYCVVLTLVGAFLGRLSGQSDFILGSPHANRFDPAFEKTLGLFVNTFGTRFQLDRNDDLTTEIARTRDKVMNAQDHIAAPLEAVIESLGLERSLSHNPLFQVLVAYQSTSRAAPSFDSAVAQILSAPFDGARFDLEWTFYPPDSGRSARLGWKSALFSREDAARIAQLFSTFATAWLAAPETPLGRVAISQETVSPTTGPRVAWAEASQTLHELVDAQCARTPTRIAVSSSHAQFTYQQLAHASDRIASLLMKAGIVPGDVVATVLPRSPTLAAAMLGVLKAGAVLLPIDPTQPTPRRQAMCAIAQAKLILHDGVDGIDKPNILLERVFSNDSTECTSRSVSSDATAYIIFTSGSTGAPRGVRVRHRNVVNTLLAVQSDFGMRADDVFAVLAPVGFDILLFELFSPLLVGAEARFVTRDEWIDPKQLAAIFQRVTAFQAVPAFMSTLLEGLRQSSAAYLGMREVTTGGDLVPPSLLEEVATLFPRARVTVTYGPTEAAILATRYVRHGQVEGHLIGEPLANVDIVIADDDGRAVPDGIEGQILIGGAGVSEGYHEDLEHTSARFHDYIGKRWFATGDSGRWRNGQLEFRGRRDNQVKIQGFRVELGEIEAILTQHPDVAEAAVRYDLSSETGARLTAFVAPRTTSGARSDASNEWRQLFDFMHDGNFDQFAGWHQSSDARPIPLNQMEKWRDTTVARIEELLSQQPRTGPPEVLEIGCGTGLLLEHLAPRCARYDATDISPVVIEQTQQRACISGATNTCFVCAAAHVEVFADRTYDLVILNSVIQYFSDEDYLRHVLELAASRTNPGGQIFIGDVRAAHLHDHFLDEVARARSQEERRVFAEIARLKANEHELLVHPALFADFAARRSAGLHVSPKLMSEANEISRYRYDVSVTLNTQTRIDVDWRETPERLDDLAFSALARELDRDPRPLGWRRVPHAWFSKNGVTPAGIIAAARNAKIAARTSWLSADREGAFDVAFQPIGKEGGNIVWPSGAHTLGTPATNRPISRSQLSKREAGIREYLKQRLPSYMNPSSIEFISSLPVTHNGKVDRTALPNSRQSRSTTNPPIGATETKVAEAWMSVLGLASLPAREDNFFHIGGSSLSAIQVAAHMRLAGFYVKPQTLFTHQTLSEFAAALPRSEHQESAALSQRARLPAHFSLTTTRSTPVSNSRGVLLTGATGFLGAHILQALVNATTTQIYCPVRAANDKAATERLRGVLQWYFGDEAARQIELRVRAFAADIANGAATWNAWSAPAPLDHIFHAAADVRHVASPSEIIRANTNGMRAVIELAVSRGAALHHVSSIGVAGVWRHAQNPPTLSERDLDLGQTLTEAYSESKFLAEGAVEAFRASGGSAAIYRASTVAPHSVTGKFQINIADHFFPRFLQAAISLGIAANKIDPALSLVPVDVMAEWIVRLADEDANEPSYHLTSRHPISYAEVVKALVADGYAVELIDQDAFGMEATARTLQDSALEPALGVVLKQTAPQTGARDIPLDSTRSWAIFDRLELNQFAATQSWLRTFFAHARSREFLPHPRRSTQSAEPH